jgi:hypothetical protein
LGQNFHGAIFSKPAVCLGFFDNLLLTLDFKALKYRQFEILNPGN